MGGRVLVRYPKAVQSWEMTMGWIELSVAIFVLLVTPGPTNTLLLIGGSERGLTRSLRLIPYEIAGYLSTVLPLALVGNALLDSLPGLRAGVALVAGVWVAYLAVKLWRVPQVVARQASVTGRTVFTTTLLNPKALIFGLVLLPHPEHLALNIGLFVAQILVVATGWTALGAVLGAGAKGRQGRDWMPLLRRAASVWLGFISVTLILRGIGVA
jgi:threonine/homoserine/homoserine lactone efflux protein